MSDVRFRGTVGFAKIERETGISSRRELPVPSPAQSSRAARRRRRRNFSWPFKTLHFLTSGPPHGAAFFPGRTFPDISGHPGGRLSVGPPSRGGLFGRVGGLHTNPKRQRGSSLKNLADASGWYDTARPRAARPAAPTPEAPPPPYDPLSPDAAGAVRRRSAARSEERRVGKAC